MALPARVLEPVPVPEVATRMRRCTFRRLNRLTVAGQSIYEVDCLYPDRKLPLPLGDLDMGMAICGTCQANHIFRPDED